MKIIPHALFSYNGLNCQVETVEIVQNRYLQRIKKMILLEMALLCVVLTVFVGRAGQREGARGAFVPRVFGQKHLGLELEENPDNAEKDFIKWVDFKVTYEALCKAYEWDVETHGGECELHWIELLAYTAAKTGGEFDKKSLNVMDQAAESLLNDGKTIEELTKELKYYAYYKEAYDAALGGLVGEYEIQGESEKVYGLKGYFPLARGFDYTHYDDFGAGRSYGYQRRHLGHDMMGLVGTPIIAVESGYVEAIGWNQYGGWRIGIRSFDGKRYYYYAHLRQNYPYAEGIEEGSIVTAGDVIGYMGHTGYSTKENVNNIEVTHLHWGLELIFDESQKECNNEIWIDVYALTRFLSRHTQPVAKVDGTREWVRTTGIRDPVVEAYKAEREKRQEKEEAEE